MKLACGVFTNIVAILISIGSFGQNYQIAGYILDQETGAPVPYASIGVIEQQRGISSNMNGFFRLLLPDNNPDHHLEISSVGYQKVTIRLSEVSWGKEQQFSMVPDTRMLDEIVISGKFQSLEDLVGRASKNRKIYLRSTPYLMNGFYRETVSTDDTYTGFTEGQGILYLNGYDPRYKNNSQQLTYDLVQWKNIRRSDYPEQVTHYLEISALLKAKDYYLYQGPLNKGKLNQFDFTVTDTTVYQDHLVLEISFEPKLEHASSINYSGKMQIKEDDQALISLEISSTGPEKFLKQESTHQDIESTFKLSFVLFGDQYYLRNASYHRAFQMNGHQYHWTTELMEVSFSGQRATFINYQQRAVLYSEMLNPQVIYHPEFWSDYSLTEDSLFNSVSGDINGLEKQFEDNNDRRLVPLPKGFENYQQMANDRNALDFIMQR